MTNPLVSICIPTYNGSTYIHKCLGSAMGQTYTNIEIVVVDDCSTDDTYKIVAEYALKDSRIKLYKNEKNLGLVDNWNRAMDLAKGEWIKFLFQDDYFNGNCIEAFVNGITDSDNIATSARNIFFDDTASAASKNYALNETITLEHLGIHTKTPAFISAKKITDFTISNICMNFIGEPTVVMFRKSMIAELGYFNKDLVQICDLEYFLRIAARYGLRYIPEPITNFRSGGADTASSANLSKRRFNMLFLDPMITTHMLLFDSHYTVFREQLGWSQKLKLALYFKTRCYEAYQVTKTSDPQHAVLLNSVAEKYPEITKHSTGTFLTRTALILVKIRRSFRNYN